jgi:protein SCO1/2
MPAHRFPPALKVSVGLLGLLLAGAFAFAVLQPIKVLPRIRLAPGFSLVDQTGAPLTSEEGRGRFTLYTFAYAGCGAECEVIDATMREVRDRVPAEVDLGGTELRLVTVSFDPERDDPAALARAAAESGADGSVWRWAAPDPAQVRTVVGSGFGAFFEEQEDGSFRFDPTFVLVDGWGVVRGQYRYQTQVSDADKLVRHIGILGEELRNSKGVASLAYEAAHLFMCYP